MSVFHVKRGGLGMVLGCVSPPLLAVVRIDVSRETIPLMERILLVAPPCLNPESLFRRIGGVCLSCFGAGLRFPCV